MQHKIVHIENISLSLDWYGAEPTAQQIADVIKQISKMINVLPGQPSIITETEDLITTIYEPDALQDERSHA
jgi:hypothetical protein